MSVLTVIGECTYHSVPKPNMPITQMVRVLNYSSLLLTQHQWLGAIRRLKRQRGCLM